VVNFGLAEKVGKTAAYVELNKIVQALARRAAWQQLDKNGVAQVVKKIYATLSMDITKKKLGQAVPVVGIITGAALNARMLAKVTSDAEHLYRERFLRERYGITAASPSASSSGAAGDSDSVAIVDIVDAELESEAEDDGDTLAV
jgi:YbbR domain-containing protein